MKRVKISFKVKGNHLTWVIKRPGLVIRGGKYIHR